MRLIKMLGLAAVAAVAAMAFVGATSAPAANTQLCNSHGALTCSSAATSVSVVNSGPGLLLNFIHDIECETIEATATPLALGSPQWIHVSELSFENCEAAGPGADCPMVVATELPLASLNKTGLDAGTLTLTSGSILIECEDPLYLVTSIYCEYDLTGVAFSVGSQHMTANEAPVDKKSGGCGGLDESTLDVLLVTSEPEIYAYILG